MLIDTLNDNQTYFKSTLVEVLAETARQSGKKIATSYKSIMRKERKGIPVYLDHTVDPTNGWRLYTGRQIRKIVEYELSLKGKEVDKR